MMMRSSSVRLTSMPFNVFPEHFLFGSHVEAKERALKDVIHQFLAAVVWRRFNEPTR